MESIIGVKEILRFKFKSIVDEKQSHRFLLNKRWMKKNVNGYARNKNKI